MATPAPCAAFAGGRRAGSDSSSYDDAASALLFTLRDPKSARPRVRYEGLKPANFEEAISTAR
jgi:hypothetical protein